MLLALFAVMATLEVGLARRQCLWGDEIFSVAVATGHSLENRAAAARPELGDFVEPDRPVPAQELRRYLNMRCPLPARLASSGQCYSPIPARRFTICSFTAGPSSLAPAILSCACFR